MRGFRMKVLFFYPPSGSYQRGEERCQANIEGSPTVFPRAPIDVMILSSLIKDEHDVEFVDFQTENLNWKDFEEYVKKSSPDVVIMSTTYGSVLNDMKAFEIVKKVDKNIVTIAKGPVFYNIPLYVLNKYFDIFKNTDIAIKGEAESVLPGLLKYLEKGKNIKNQRGIFFKIKTSFKETGISKPFDMEKNASCR